MLKQWILGGLKFSKYLRGVYITCVIPGTGHSVDLLSNSSLDQRTFAGHVFHKGVLKAILL